MSLSVHQRLMMYHVATAAYTLWHSLIIAASRDLLATAWLSCCY